MARAPQPDVLPAPDRRSPRPRPRSRYDPTPLSLVFHPTGHVHTGESGPGAKNPEPLYLKDLRTAYWFEYLADQKTAYIQYNQVGNQGQENLDQFCGRLFKFIESNDVEKLVIDLRWNGGSDNFLNRPLAHGLIRCEKINQSGKLFVIVGRNTFSAAMCGATDIEQHRRLKFVFRFHAFQ